jgi:hypothetical protein
VPELLKEKTVKLSSLPTVSRARVDPDRYKTDEEQVALS